MKKLALLLSAFALCGCGMFGDNQPHKRPEAPWHPASAMLTKYIINADGSLTRRQLETGLHNDFNAADRNRTGCLDTDETRQINDQRLAEDKSTASPLVDFSGKGCIDFDAFASTPRSLFDTLDRDSNGVLTAQEINPYAAAPKKDDGQGNDHHDGGGKPKGN